MKDLDSQIRDIYAEIVSYEGDFGDAIEHGSYNPYEMIYDLELTPFQRIGVSTAVLHYLASAIDNTTYESAVENHGRVVRAMLMDGLLESQPFVRSSAKAFLESESNFLRAPKQVYERVICPETDDSPDAKQCAIADD